MKAKKYKSYDRLTGEVHFDNFNIDFLRYFKLENLLFSVVGSFVGFFAWTSYDKFFEWTLSIDINKWYTISFSEGIIWFLITATIAYYAVGTRHGAARIAGRRGLFTFSIMLISLISLLAATGKITWSTEFYYLIKYAMSGLVVESVFAIPFDYGIAFLEGIRKKK